MDKGKSSPQEDRDDGMGHSFPEEGNGVYMKTRKGSRPVEYMVERTIDTLDVYGHSFLS